VKMNSRLSAVPVHFQNRHHRMAIVLALFAVYSLGFKVFYPTPARGGTTLIFFALAVIPILTAASWFGLKGGLAAWFISIPLVLFLLAWSGEPAFRVMIEGGGFITLALLLIAVIPVGRLHDLSQQMEREALERQKAEHALREKQHFIQQVMEHIPDIVYIHDLNENRIEAGYRAKHVNGEWRWFYTQEVVLSHNDDGSPRQLLGTAQDMTERKLLGKSALEQEKLQVALEKERELSQLKNRLMITLSHEFRTPLSVIMASGELLERYFDRLTPARRAECLATIKTHIMHLREMLDDITTLVGEGDLVPRFNPSPMDLEHFCREMAEEFQASLGTTYTIMYTAAGDLNPISADADLLRPILKNVLSNAVKYSHKGGTVYCSLSRQGDRVHLEVRDEGIGIPAADQSRIFETFHRASNVSHIGGLGLGLRIVRDYVRLHRGSVEIVSEEGAGTTVTLRLPANLP